nr:MAG TPA: presenilin enhancer-2 subunit of gamma secretase [Bacteriophage sp.]
MSATVIVSCVCLLVWLYLSARYTSECAVRESVSQSDILTKDLIKFFYQSSLACLPFLWFVCFLFLQIIHSQCRRTRTTTDRTKICCATITPYIVLPHRCEAVKINY